MCYHVVQFLLLVFIFHTYWYSDILWMVLLYIFNGNTISLDRIKCIMYRPVFLSVERDSKQYLVCKWSEISEQFVAWRHSVWGDMMSQYSCMETLVVLCKVNACQCGGVAASLTTRYRRRLFPMALFQDKERWYEEGEKRTKHRWENIEREICKNELCRPSCGHHSIKTNDTIKLSLYVVSVYWWTTTSVFSVGSFLYIV